MTIHSDDTRDLRIHNTIEIAVCVVASLSKITRKQAIACLSVGPNAHEHALDVICEMHGLTRADLSDRIEAFIENEPEEPRANAVPTDAPSWSDATPA